MLHKVSRKPPRLHQDDSVYFLTFCTFRRREILHSQGVPEVLIRNLKFYGRRIRELIAYTIQKEHVHLMVDVESVEHMSDFLRDFKKWTAHQILKSIPVPSPLWLRGTMDHRIRNEKDFENHLTYLFSNSWKHLRIKPKDFPHHNFLEFVEKGWFDIDFLGPYSEGESGFEKLE